MAQVHVFTNGCFDLLHPGHVDLLERARALGDRLTVALNSDASVRRLKGPHKPYIPEHDRRRMLLALRAVDEVVIFDEPTPLELIEQLKPDVLVKGGDWPVEQIVGSKETLARGGKVYSLTLLPGYSTTAVVAEIIRKRTADPRPE
jgi:D-beta-D-heptose 7-phosphate kinase/D-beta-D-heptose 1-phosphate adenosyltransferase